MNRYAPPSTSGIYAIRNLNNGKFYIGSAVKLSGRFRTHLCDLRKGRHHSQHLQRSWNKHGAESFAFEVLELCPADDLITREQWWIDTCEPPYNIAPNAGSTRGHRWTEAQRKRFIEARGIGLHEHDGERLTLTEIARRTGATFQTLYRRVVEQGMTVERALSVPIEEVFHQRALKVHRNRTPERKAEIARKMSEVLTGRTSPSRHKVVEYQGQQTTLQRLSAEMNLDFRRLHKRVHQGMSVEEAVRLDGADNARTDPVRRKVWYECTCAGRRAVGYVPMSDEGRQRQRAAVVKYNQTREVTPAMREKMSKAHRTKASVERFDYEGEALTVMDMSERFGIDRHVLRKRLNAGWPIHDAVTRPVRRNKK